MTDLLTPGFATKLEGFGINKGDVVVDYGCGPGRYLEKASELVGKDGLVYAADVNKIAIEEVQGLIARQGLTNVEPVLINGYDSGLESDCADVIYALDMFHAVEKPERFLAELERILKRTGGLILEDGHQPREDSKKKVNSSRLWNIEAETEDYLVCLPKK